MGFARGRWTWLVLLTLLACNLTRALPTPTPPPTLPPTPPPLLDEPALDGEPVNPDCAATPSGWIPYTVEPGDHMGLLADQTSSTIQELVAGNCLDNPDQIFVGQVLYVPHQPVILP